VAIGAAYRHDAKAVAIPEYRIVKEAVEAERARFAKAVKAVSHGIGKLQTKARNLPGAAGEEIGYLLDAYRQMLQGSRLVRGVEARIGDERINAEAAISHEIGHIVEGFAAVDDAYLAARIEDIRDVGRRLIVQLSDGPQRPFAQLPRNPVILAEELSPADTALLDPARVAGLATVAGGPASHAAIMARSLGLPAVVGAAGIVDGVSGGGAVIIDGGTGRIILDPTPATLAFYRLKRAEFLRTRRRLHHLRKVPAVTRDGIEVGLEANLELPGEIDAVLDSGAAGVGLLRSEFFYMNRSDLPARRSSMRRCATSSNAWPDGR
jgi:phosphotransferase system enzyme I (PtsI)